MEREVANVKRQIAVHSDLGRHVLTFHIICFIGKKCHWSRAGDILIY